MTYEIQLTDEFGTRLSDGGKAYRFRESRIDSYLNLPICDRIVLDFTGVRSANSSFVNALVSGIFEQHGEGPLQKIVFRGCLPHVKALVQSAIDLGLTKHGERV